MPLIKGFLHSKQQLNTWIKSERLISTNRVRPPRGVSPYPLRWPFHSVMLAAHRQNNALGNRRVSR
jgi:hypothetical protein